MKKSTANIIFIILIVFAGLALAVLTSCKVNRAVQKQSVNSTAVAKIDSGNTAKVDIGAIAKGEKINQNLSTWFKNTYTLQPIINNNDTTIKEYITITNEGGTTIINNKEKFFDSGWQKSMDSNWRKSFDSLRLQLKTKEVKSKVEVLSLFQVIGICILAVLLILLLTNLSIESALQKFKNLKP
jgi:hypothetical protein